VGKAKIMDRHMNFQKFKLFWNVCYANVSAEFKQKKKLEETKCKGKDENQRHILRDRRSCPACWAIGTKELKYCTVR
jgi:hypothetical protein